MRTVNMLHAKTHLSQIVEAVESGAEREVIIARNGKPAVKIVPIGKIKTGPRLGIAEGKFPAISQEEWDADDEEIAALFLDGEI